MDRAQSQTDTATRLTAATAAPPLGELAAPDTETAAPPPPLPRLLSLAQALAWIATRDRAFAGLGELNTCNSTRLIIKFVVWKRGGRKYAIVGDAITPIHLAWKELQSAIADGKVHVSGRPGATYIERGARAGLLLHAPDLKLSEHGADTSEPSDQLTLTTEGNSPAWFDIQVDALQLQKAFPSSPQAAPSAAASAKRGPKRAPEWGLVLTRAVEWLEHQGGFMAGDIECREPADLKDFMRATWRREFPAVSLPSRKTVDRYAADAQAEFERRRAY